MRVAFGLLFVVIAIFLFSFAAVKINGIVEKRNNQAPQIEFSTFTSAVCENEESFVKCKDELFVNCNGKVSKADDAAECSGFNLDKNKISGFAAFKKDWKDPRNS